MRQQGDLAHAQKELKDARTELALVKGKIDVMDKYATVCTYRSEFAL